MLYLWSLTLLYVIINSAYSKYIAGCDFYYNKGLSDELYYDLSELHGEDFTGSLADTNFTLSMAMCGVSLSSIECENDRGSLCIYEKDNDDKEEYYTQIGGFELEPNPIFDVLDKSLPDTGVMVTYDNGFWDDKATTYVIIGCDEIKPAKEVIDFTANADYTEFTIIIESNKYGCPTDGPNIPINIETGLSSGTVFIITLLFISFFYLSIGMIYKSSQLGTSGVESIPNIDFWRNLPSLVLEGCQFFFKYITRQSK